ncbi:MAG: carboxyl transferase domain-containing protein, partial [Haliscomenobacter sp.]
AAQMLHQKEKEYQEAFAHPYRAAQRGFIDEVIDPAETRRKLIRAFQMAANKVAQLPKKKHGNIPL